MRLKNLMWSVVLLPNLAGPSYRMARPAAHPVVLSSPPIPPPVCIGETHNRPEHTRIEEETILALHQRGYTTVDFEFPRDLQPALETYLHSERGPEDVKRFFATYVDLKLASMDIDPPPSMRERIIDTTQNNIDLRRVLGLTVTSFDAGLAIHLIDAPTTSPSSHARDDAELFANMPGRNKAMAEMLAKDAAQGGTIALNGDLHESKTLVPSSLPDDLLKKGVQCQVFELAIDGQRPEIALGSPRKLEPAGQLVGSSREILTALYPDIWSQSLPTTLSEPLPVPPIRDSVAAR